MNDKTLWMMVGAPGSGKTYVAKHFLMRGTGWRYVSRDEVRFEFLADDEEYFAHENEVYDIFIYRLRAALEEEGCFNVIADATHLNKWSRGKLIRNLKKECHFDFNIVPVVVLASESDMLQRNAQREGRSCVPEENLKDMIDNYMSPKTDPFANEYAGIFYYNNYS